MHQHGWYATREQLKRAIGAMGRGENAIIDAQLASATAEIRNRLARSFIPYRTTRYFSWPPELLDRLWELDLDDDLLSVSSLTSENGDVTITDYFLYPTAGPRYRQIQLDQSTSAVFDYVDTPQRAVAVTGLWGWGQDTKAAGTLAEALDASETEVQVSDGSLVGVGDVMLVDSEQIAVTEKATLNSTATITADVGAQAATVTVPLSSGALVKAGELIQIDSEIMLVESVTGNNAAVQRSQEATVLAAHTSGAVVYVFRSLTTVRGANGTTAATHSDGATVAKYASPDDITGLCLAQAIFNYQQDKSGQSGRQGNDNAQFQINNPALGYRWIMAERAYQDSKRRLLFA